MAAEEMQRVMMRGQVADQTTATRRINSFWTLARSAKKSRVLAHGFAKTR
jgi:hypothetical protein